MRKIIVRLGRQHGFRPISGPATWGDRSAAARSVIHLLETTAASVAGTQDGSGWGGRTKPQPLSGEPREAFAGHRGGPNFVEAPPHTHWQLNKMARGSTYQAAWPRPQALDSIAPEVEAICPQPCRTDRPDRRLRKVGYIALLSLCGKPDTRLSARCGLRQRGGA
jgi:hypothetical protein